MSNKIFDIVIVGGGMVGATLACILNKEKFYVAVIEKRKNDFYENDIYQDSRVSALGYSSINILKKYKIWDSISKNKCAPYSKLETWEQKDFTLNFDAQSVGLSELGFMVENENLIQVLWNTLNVQNITTLCSVTIHNLIKKNNLWKIFLTNGQTLLTKLVIAADGANSIVRKFAGIGTYGWQYKQSCLSMIIECDHLSGNIAWQKFTSQGPVAFLPLYKNKASLIWYNNLERIRELQSLSLKHLKKEISIHFPTRLVCSQIKKINCFSLMRHHAYHYVISGLALIGDAAHTINPLAGQGLNLGYRDIHALVDVLVTARHFSENWEKKNVLLLYEARRKLDNNIMQIGMDYFYFLFSNELKYIKLFRNLSLKMINDNVLLKNQILQYAIGL